MLMEIPAIGVAAAVVAAAVAAVTLDAAEARGQKTSEEGADPLFSCLQLKVYAEIPAFYRCLDPVLKLV